MYIESQIKGALQKFGIDVFPHMENNNSAQVQQHFTVGVVLSDICADAQLCGCAAVRSGGEGACVCTVNMKTHRTFFSGSFVSFSLLLLLLFLLSVSLTPVAVVAV